MKPRCENGTIAASVLFASALLLSVSLVISASDVAMASEQTTIQATAEAHAQAAHKGNQSYNKYIEQIATPHPPKPSLRPPSVHVMAPATSTIRVR